MASHWYDNTITNANANSCVYVQIGETCAAGRHIGSRDGSHSGTFSRVRCRRAAHRGEKCAAICAISVAYVAYSGTFRPFFDERTHERTHENPRKRRTNPRIRRTNPSFCKRTQGTTCRRRAEIGFAINGLPPFARASHNPARRAPNPRPASPPIDPDRRLTRSDTSAIIPS
jgi:hypothetical protein